MEIFKTVTRQMSCQEFEQIQNSDHCITENRILFRLSKSWSFGDNIIVEFREIVNCPQIKTNCSLCNTELRDRITELEKFNRILSDELLKYYDDDEQENDYGYGVYSISEICERRKNLKEKIQSINHQDPTII